MVLWKASLSCQKAYGKPLCMAPGRTGELCVWVNIPTRAVGCMDRLKGDGHDAQQWLSPRGHQAHQVLPTPLPYGSSILRKLSGVEEEAILALGFQH